MSTDPEVLKSVFVEFVKKNRYQFFDKSYADCIKIDDITLTTAMDWDGVVQGDVFHLPELGKFIFLKEIQNNHEYDSYESYTILRIFELNEDEYFKVVGFYSSYDGEDWSYCSFEPVKKKITYIEEWV